MITINGRGTYARGCPFPISAPMQMAEEQERDREALRIAAERHRRERELHRKEAEDARQRKKEAFQR